MEGRCLCGDISFKLSIDELKIYKCYCSLCQKQSGTESNLATIWLLADDLPVLHLWSRMGIWQGVMEELNLLDLMAIKR